MAKNLLHRLRDQGCDREPFTPEHAECVCRLTNAAADEIERLQKAEETVRAAFNLATSGWPFDKLNDAVAKAEAYVANLHDDA